MTMPATSPRRVWIREGFLLATWLGAAAVFGLIVDSFGMCLAIALAIYLAVQLFHAYQLQRWLISNRQEPLAGRGVWQEIFTALHRMKQRNQQRKSRLRIIVAEFQSSTAALPDGTVVLDSTGRISWFNQAAALLLGLRVSQDRGQRLINLLRHPEVPGFLAGQTNGAALEMPSPVSDDTTILLRIVPYGNNQRLLIVRDISEQKRLDAMRRDFVANASHELRTPLTALRGYLGMMAAEVSSTGSVPDIWQKPVCEMSRQARRMEAMIDSLLELARVEGDGMAVTHAAVDVSDKVKTFVEDLSAGDGADREFVLDLEDDLSLYGAYREIESVISNLLSNAIRYTPVNGRIEVKWWRDESGAHFSVVDDGPGIEPQHLSRLTERFYRADTSRNASTGGTGLGLAIVKHCLEHHGAELAIDSTPGRGARFTCHFPGQRILVTKPVVPPR